MSSSNIHTSEISHLLHRRPIILMAKSHEREGSIMSSAAPATGSIETRTTRWLVAVVLLCLVVTGYFDRISVAVLFTNADFQAAMGTGFDPALFGMLMTAFFIPYGIASVFLSFTGDALGPRRMLIAGSSIWGVLMIVMGSLSSYPSMLLSRILLGVAEGPQFSWILKIVSRWFPRTEHGRANTIWLAGSPLGSAIGFPLVIALVSAFGWRVAFYMLAGLSILVMTPLLFLVVKDWPPYPSQAEEQKSPRAGDILRDCGVFLRDINFWLLTLCDCGELIYLWGLNSWLPTYLQKVQNFDIGHLGFYSSLPFILLFIGEILSGFLADRFDKRAILIFIGLAGAAVLLYAGTVASDSTTAAVIIALSSGSFGLAVPATYALTQRIVPAPVLASGAGVINGIANTVGAFAPFAMGLIISATDDFNAGLMVLVIGSLCCSCAILPLIRRY
jgi:sugar phosphate permease